MNIDFDYDSDCDNDLDIVDFDKVVDDMIGIHILLLGSFFDIDFFCTLQSFN